MEEFVSYCIFIFWLVLTYVFCYLWISLINQYLVYSVIFNIILGKQFFHDFSKADVLISSLQTNKRKSSYPLFLFNNGSVIQITDTQNAV